MKVVEQAERRGSTSWESTRTPWRTAGLAEQASRQESHKAHRTQSALESLDWRLFQQPPKGYFMTRCNTFHVKNQNPELNLLTVLTEAMGYHQIDPMPCSNRLKK
jgi:hypothetical protein